MTVIKILFVTKIVLTYVLYNNKVEQFKIKSACIPEIDPSFFSRWAWEGAYLSMMFEIPCRFEDIIAHKQIIQ
jgi:hypothetical protein